MKYAHKYWRRLTKHRNNGFDLALRHFHDEERTAQYRFFERHSTSRTYSYSTDVIQNWRGAQYMGYERCPSCLTPSAVYWGWRYCKTLPAVRRRFCLFCHKHSTQRGPDIRKSRAEELRATGWTVRRIAAQLYTEGLCNVSHATVACWTTRHLTSNYRYPVGVRQRAAALRASGLSWNRIAGTLRTETGRPVTKSTVIKWVLHQPQGSSTA